MIQGFNIAQDEWKATPSSVCIAATAPQHQLFILNARFDVYQLQNAELRTKLESSQRVKDEQKLEIERLKLKLTGLNERLRQNSGNSSLPPSSDSPFGQSAGRGSSGRKQGAQTGHSGICGALLLGEDVCPARRQVIELKYGRTFITEYRRHRIRCLSCRTVNCARWSSEALTGTFGASILAVVAYLTGRLNLSQRDTAQALSELFNLRIGLGSISALQRRVSTRLAEPVNQALEFVQRQNSQCVDETGWREKDRSNWLWVNCAEKVTVFQVQETRTQNAAKAIIDEDEFGVVTTDRYPGYNFLQGWRRQICSRAFEKRFHGDVRARRCRIKRDWQTAFGGNGRGV